MEMAVSPSLTTTPAPSEESLRAGAYTLLARLLAMPPDGELLDRLAAVEVDGQTGPGLASAWGMLALAARRTTPEAAAEEYQALFIGLGRGELVPYASYYLTGFLMERPLALLRRDLAALGFEREAEVCEPEDHAAALCEVMALLVDGEGSAAMPEVQRAFFDAHLASWMGRFFADLRESHNGRFYRAVGQFGEAFVGNEQRYYAMPV